MRRIELEVELHGRRVGTLRGRAGGGVRFSADQDWLESDQRPRLGWAFLADPRPRDGKTRLPPWFENLLPEVGSPLRRRICEHHGLYEHDDAALLGVLRRDLPGAVELRGTVDPDVDDDDDDDDDASFEGRLRFSVAGMQPKLSMLRRDDERFVLPAKDELGDWYVKLSGPRYSDLPQIEHATMGWARRSGLHVPEHDCVPVEQLVDVPAGYLDGSRFAFVIRRFDRNGDERIHQEDFAQALEIRPYDKYGGPGRLAVSYDSLTRLVDDAAGAMGRDEMIDRIAFVVASGNDDAHLKNWSFQWALGSTRPCLSPCYDLVATPAWPEFGWEGSHPPQLALPLDRSKSLHDLDLERVRSFAHRARTPSAVDRFMSALERIRDAWREQEPECPERMRTAMRTHWASVPVLAVVGGLPS